MIAGPSQYSLSGWRIDGWKRALAEQGLASEGLLEAGDFGFESGARAARTLLERNPDLTAIIASSDQMALAALEVARERGLAVPLDISLISFDNTPIVRFTQPPLTAVDQPIAETVSRAVEQLIARREDEGSNAVIEVAAALVERASTAPAPVRA
jgi:LacI family transcriptional regulator